MSIRSWLIDFLSKDEKDAIWVTYGDTQEELSINKLYFYTCVNMVANTLSKCEFKTFEKGEETKEREYYLWNVEPNPNQNRSQFMSKLILHLFMENEALVFQDKNSIYIADSFIRNKKGLKNDEFTQIELDGEEITKKMKPTDILYFELHSEKIKKYFDEMFNLYKKLMSYGVKQFKAEVGNKGFFEVDAAAQGNEEDDERRKESLKASFKDFWEKENAIMELNKGYKYVSLNKASTSSGNSQNSTRDIRQMINDIATYVGTAFGVPPKLLIGENENTSNAMDEFLTLGIDPIANLFEVEINRKRYGFNKFKDDTRLTIDTKATKHVDLFSVATSVDKLISSGAFTINELRKLVGESPLTSDIGSTHFMTKNYSTVDLITRGIDDPEINDSGGGKDG